MGWNVSLHRRRGVWQGVRAHGWIAQSVEQRTENPRSVFSHLLRYTISPNQIRGIFTRPCFVPTLTLSEVSAIFYARDTMEGYNDAFMGAV